MQERDLYTLQAIASQGKYKYINFIQKGYYAVAESTNGFCYLRIADKNMKTFNEGFFEFTGRFIANDVELPLGDDLYSFSGKKIGSFMYKEPFDIPIGQQGEFYCTFKRVELLTWLKHFLSGWKTADANKYHLIFYRDSDIWHLRGYSGTKLFTKDIIPSLNDNITDKSFRFTVNPHTLRTIFKWFKGDSVTLYFHNGNYECRSAIFMSEDNKLAVLMPIARKK